MSKRLRPPRAITPDLPLQLAQPVIDTVIPNRRTGHARDGLTKRPHEVGSHNYPNKFAILNNRQSLDAAFLYQAARLSER